MRLALVAVCLVALGALTFASVRAYFEVDELRLPDVTGRTLSEATATLREAGLAVSSYPDFALDAPPDVVTDQSPVAGSRVRRGRTVSLGVNTPAEANRVPTLVGRTEAEATRTAAELNLAIADVAYVHHDGAPPGRVVEQAPGAGDAISGDATLSLVVSRGPAPQPIEVPDVVGLDLGDARQRLREAGFQRVEAIASRVGRRDADEVVNQSPEAGQEVPPGSAVSLAYALEGGDVVEVPPVQGLTLWRAQLALESAGLAVGSVDYVDRAGEPEGVVETRPAGYTLAGAPVRVVVNGEPGGANVLLDRSGRNDPRAGIGGDEDEAEDEDADGPAGGRTVPFRFAPSELGVRSLVENAYDLRLVVDDDEGERTALERTVPAGEAVEATVTVYGDEPLLQTYVNGVFFQAWRP